VFNVILSYISIISWGSFLLLTETTVQCLNRPHASNE